MLALLTLSILSTRPAQPILPTLPALPARALALLTLPILPTFPTVPTRSASAETFTARVIGVADGDTLTARVIGVTDGDTLTAVRTGRPEVIRLRGIDAPERGQAYCERAKQYAAALAFGQVVAVEAAGRDRYGRLLAEVRLPDGRSLNEELVRAGYAWWFRRYSADRTLAQLEAEARTGRRGLWADPSPVPPWEYRQTRARSRGLVGARRPWRPGPPRPAPLRFTE
jgi:micrococcal nuclease